MNYEKFGKGIKGFGILLGVVIAVLFTVSIVGQCKDGAKVQLPGDENVTPLTPEEIDGFADDAKREAAKSNRQ